MSNPPIDWTGVRDLLRRCRQMDEAQSLAVVQQIDRRLNDWRNGREGSPDEEQLLSALEILTCL